MKNINELKINDKVQKEIAYESINELLEFTDINVEVVETLVSEYIDIAKTSIVDYSGIDKNGDILHIEFHTGLPNEELDEKIYGYSCSLRRKYKRKVNSYAICTEDIEHTERKLDIGKKNTFKYDVLSLHHINARIELNNIKKKKNTNKKLTPKEITTLKMVLYTKYDKEPHEIMLEACTLTNELNTLTQNQLNEIKKIQELTSLKILDEKYHRQIAKVIEMKNSLFYEDIMEYGEMVRENEKVSVIKKLINDMTISKIAQIVELSEEDVNNLIQKHNIKKY